MRIQVEFRQQRWEVISGEMEIPADIDPSDIEALEDWLRNTVFYEDGPGLSVIDEGPVDAPWSWSLRNRRRTSDDGYSYELKYDVLT